MNEENITRQRLHSAKSFLFCGGYRNGTHFVWDKLGEKTRKFWKTYDSRARVDCSKLIRLAKRWSLRSWGHGKADETGGNRFISGVKAIHLGAWNVCTRSWGRKMLPCQSTFQRRFALVLRDEITQWNDTMHWLSNNRPVREIFNQLRWLIIEKCV